MKDSDNQLPSITLLPLMTLRPQTTEEKLIWANHIIKVLKEETKKEKERRAKAIKQLEFYEFLMSKEQKGALILKNKKFKEVVNQKNIRIKQLKEENQELIMNLARLQQTGLITKEDTS